ncbi:hypothetical protein K7472_14585 [Streptomyces sp. PTM05]|uniref:Uncharacterized protein n=1 Tax=Streptantibioticus parmotrematis TaxID=2873249 RepID=A0ABS7QSA8_9ACTN|nr:hypothetical protein [Streptantibioticus parmotrematis]MBY8886076.1 hypothetical protein [Streptantibioticus parmotrematis]
MAQPRHDWWLSRIVDTVIDETRVVVDETLDRVRDAEHDIRRGLTRLVEGERHHHPGHPDSSASQATSPTDDQQPTG